MNEQPLPDPAPEQVLGVAPDASEAEVRAAYLRKVAEHPPDRAPDEFERVRDAYAALSDPARRSERLLAATPGVSFVSLLDQAAPPRRHVGPEPWLRVLRRCDHEQ